MSEEWRICVPIVRDMIDSAMECEDMDERVQLIAKLYRYLVQEEKCHDMIKSNAKLAKVIKNKLEEFIDTRYSETFKEFESDINMICTQTIVPEKNKMSEEWRICIPIVSDMIDDAMECEDMDERVQLIAKLYRYLVQEEKCHAMIKSNAKLTKAVKNKLEEFIDTPYSETFKEFESDINQICAQTVGSQSPKNVYPSPRWKVTTNQDCELTHRKTSNQQENEAVEIRVQIQPAYIDKDEERAAPSKRTGYCLVM